MYRFIRVSLVTMSALVLMAGSSIAGDVVSNNSDWAKDYPEQYADWKKTSKSDQIKDMLNKNLLFRLCQFLRIGRTVAL